MLCGAGFGLFQTPNNSTIISSAPTKRSGGASGMLGMARLLGQTFGTTLVALLFSFVVHDRVRRSALWSEVGLLLWRRLSAVCGCRNRLR